MRQRGGLLACVLAVFACAAGAAGSGVAAPASLQLGPQAFGSCSSLIAYARGHFAATGGIPDPPVAALGTPAVTSSSSSSSHSATPSLASSAAATTGGGTSSSPSYSTTNDQEPGVDEPDIVKTDGSTIFAIAQNTLYAVDVSSGTPRLVDSLDLGSGGYGAQLLLSGTTLIVISGEGPIAYATTGEGPVAQAASTPAIAYSPYFYGGRTVLTEVVVQDPSAMSVTQTMTVDGRFVDARQNGATARIIVSSAPEGIYEPQLRTTASGWVPAWQYRNDRTGRHYNRLVAPCDTIQRPAQFSGLGMLTILTLNLGDGLSTAQSDSLMADAQVVYGSQDSLYVATQGWLNPLTPYAELPTAQTTVIDRFDVTDPDRTSFVASGEVPGYLLNQFSLSEYNGYLRVATTSRPIWWNGFEQQLSSQSSVTVLATQGSELVPVGQVSGLGAGEQIYSVRFDGDSGYVTTFRQADPFYTLDLSSPTAPRVAGQLELEGYSSYLQPLGNGLLLGIGQSVDPTSNEPSGTQLELFDVSNLADPKLLAQSSLGEGSSSQVEYDHHALLFWPPTSLAVLPVQIYPTSSSSSGGSVVTTTQSFTGAIAFRLDSKGITELGRISQEPVDGSSPAIERALVNGDALYTLSEVGLLESNLDTLAPESFVSFPAPQVPTPIPEPLPTQTVTGTGLPTPIAEPG